ncbi:hypothetical protein KI387_021971 [Taxus chinensis]|uniref:Dehydrin 2 n=1 Tax=Taxus chinensis TaxID=29808 RepID=A0AA38GB52_TAXCH|nr:hypothetical protein KI387_021971 [Taxus chinensis]
MADSNAPEHQDRGLFGLFGKKKEEETHQQQPTGHVGDVHHAAPVSQGHVEEPKRYGEAEKKPLKGDSKEKLHRSNSSSSSSSSDEEGGEKGEKKKKKKGGLKDKLGGGHKKEGEEHAQGEKKEGLLDKIKDKLPGQHAKA